MYFTNPTWYFEMFVLSFEGYVVSLRVIEKACLP